VQFYLNDYKKKTAYAVLPEHENSRADYEITAINQDLKIRVRHINVEETLEWIFDKKHELIKKMLEEKFPY